MSEGDEARIAARHIATSVELRGEAERVLPVLVERCRAPAPEEIMRVMISQAPALGIPDRSEGEWAALFSVYLEALAEVPIEAIEEAFRRWHHCEMYPNDPGRHVFFPKPAELFKLAAPRRAELFKAMGRTQRALADEKHQPRKPIDAAERAKVQAMAADLAGRLGSKSDEIKSAAPKLARTPHEAARALREQAEEWPEEPI